MKLDGMAQAFQEQLELAGFRSGSASWSTASSEPRPFGEERQANSATPEDLDYQHPRALDPKPPEVAWLKDHHNLIKNLLAWLSHIKPAAWDTPLSTARRADCCKNCS